MRSYTKIFLIVSIISLFLLQGCGQSQSESLNSDSPPHIENLLLVKQYESLKQITEDSDLVVTVKPTGKYEDLDVQKSKVRLSDLKVKRVLGGDPAFADKTIRVVELESMSIDKYGPSEYVLFLTRYDGPVATKQDFVLTGVYQGLFSIQNEKKLAYEPKKYKGIDLFQSEVASHDLDKLAQDVHALMIKK